MSETDEVLAPVRAALVRTGKVLLWRNNTGVARYEDAKVVYGLGKGSPDLVGMLRGSGRLFAIEVKSARGRVSNHQAQWHAVVRSAGGFVAVVRSVDEALEALVRALAGGVE